MQQPDNLLTRSLDRHETVNLGLTVTPLEHLNRLGTTLGITLLAKRDDQTSLALGGNKVRQLEYYLGQAKAHRADTILITGAVQSNFVRLCAAAARTQGWHPVVQLEDRVLNKDSIYHQSGNVLLNHLLGADIHYFATGEDEKAADANLDSIAEDISGKGGKPYVIHLGMEHPPLGALGYAGCAAEIHAQCQQQRRWPDHVVIPSGSGLTHAGFLVGARSLGWDVPVHGICVRRAAGPQHKRILTRSRELNGLLGDLTAITEADVRVYDHVLSPGYGQLNASTLSAIKHSARTEAMLLDPVYSGRTMAGLINLVDTGTIKPHQTVLFIHTGGIPALFAYQDELTAAALVNPR
ncbi:MAG: D-cysteine desulfhydrase family protein [Gammaproteobacteria bacterium]|nr:D-cysteine desulfhydrase family protein [Gammaproteobacteria bacterium]